MKKYKKEITTEISTVIAIYNKKDNILPMIERVETSFQKYFEKYEIIFVNDRSKDGSYELLKYILML